MDILAELNPAQREAVEAIGEPVLILAGPGSGKTRVIAHRVAYLITVCRISPHRIMAVTFTNKAAREMEERLHRLIAALLFVQVAPTSYRHITFLESLSTRTLWLPLA